MRTEQEMMNLIIETARADERIRAVYMNGSRTNPHVPKDIFQDYDIVYVVEETASFREDKSWIDRFGKRLYMQCPEEMDLILGHGGDVSQSYGWLMQFADGNRLDLHVNTVPCSRQDVLADKLCVILLDKDGILPPIPPADDVDYHVKRPSQEEFSCCLNEFWWLMNNAAKGLWREEVPYVMDMVHLYIRPQLVKLLSWYIGEETGYSISIGKSGKYMKKYLPRDIWGRYLKTYTDSEIEHMWEGIFIMCSLFSEISREIAGKSQYIINEEEAENSLFYLEHVYRLPKDAKEIF